MSMCSMGSVGVMAHAKRVLGLVNNAAASRAMGIPVL